jgi:3-phenylpropionate/trans-cinnamate dioxygenase ferredoxin subunit
VSESAEFVRACAVSDLKDGGAISVVLGGDEIAIVKTEGEVFAIRDW